MTHMAMQKEKAYLEMQSSILISFSQMPILIFNIIQNSSASNIEPDNHMYLDGEQHSGSMYPLLPFFRRSHPQSKAILVGLNHRPGNAITILDPSLTASIGLAHGCSCNQ